MSLLSYHWLLENKYQTQYEYDSLIDMADMHHEAMAEFFEMPFSDIGIWLVLTVKDTDPDNYRFFTARIDSFGLSPYFKDLNNEWSRYEVPEKFHNELKHIESELC